MRIKPPKETSLLSRERLLVISRDCSADGRDSNDSTVASEMLHSMRVSCCKRVLLRYFSNGMSINDLAASAHEIVSSRRVG